MAAFITFGLATSKNPLAFAIPKLGEAKGRDFVPEPPLDKEKTSV